MLCEVCVCVQSTAQFSLLTDVAYGLHTEELLRRWCLNDAFFQVARVVWYKQPSSHRVQVRSVVCAAKERRSRRVALLQAPYAFCIAVISPCSEQRKAEGFTYIVAFTSVDTLANYLLQTNEYRLPSCLCVLLVIRVRWKAVNVRRMLWYNIYSRALASSGLDGVVINMLAPSLGEEPGNSVEVRK